MLQEVQVVLETGDPEEVSTCVQLYNILHVLLFP